MLKHLTGEVDSGSQSSAFAAPTAQQTFIAAGAVITRQRPGTAKGLIFLTLEDETSHANVIVMPDIYAADPMVVVHKRFIRVEGKVQNQEGIVHVKAEKITPLVACSAGPESHDFLLNMKAHLGGPVTNYREPSVPYVVES